MTFIVVGDAFEEEFFKTLGVGAVIQASGFGNPDHNGVYRVTTLYNGYGIGVEKL